MRIPADFIFTGYIIMYFEFTRTFLFIMVTNIIICTFHKLILHALDKVYIQSFFLYDKQFQVIIAMHLIFYFKQCSQITGITVHIALFENISCVMKINSFIFYFIRMIREQNLKS